MEATAALKTSALTRTFGRRRALRDIDLTIEAGAFFGILGANGAGKTTLLHLTAGLLTPSSGDVRVLGLDPVRHPDRVRHRIGYVPEEPALYDELSIERLLAFVAGARGLSRKTGRNAVSAQIERFGLEDHAKRACGVLSRGLRQRTALAAAFVGDPQLVLLDEPTTGLDPDARAAVHEGLLREAGDRTFVLCSHDLLEVSALATECALLRRGEVASRGPTAAVLASASWPTQVEGAPA